MHPNPAGVKIIVARMLPYVKKLARPQVKQLMFKRLLSVGGFTLLSRITGFARDVAAGLDAGQRRPVRRLFCRLPVSQLFPRHFRRRHHQSRLPAALCRAACQGRACRRRRNSPIGVFAWQMAAQVVLLVLATVFMPLIVRVLAPGLRRSGAVRADRPPGAHHLSLSDPDRGGGAAFRHAQCHRALLGRRRLVQSAQSGDDRHAARVALVSQRRLCRGLGRLAGRRGATDLHVCGRARARACGCASPGRAGRPRSRNSSRPSAR